MLNHKYNILFLHWKNTKNIGDLSCCPADYFDKFKQIQTNSIVRDFREINSVPRNINLIIYGGGLLPEFPYLHFYREAFPKAKLVAWGLGITGRNLKKVDPLVHLSRKDKFDLYSSRDYEATDNYVPCVSCMSPLFDISNKEVKHETLCYGHSDMKPLELESKKYGVPYKDNTNVSSLSEALDFISSGNHIITSTFHGAYWATLLNKKVTMIPFGSKFFNLKYLPSISYDFKSALATGRSFDGCLEEARYLNTKFFKKVTNLLP